MSDDVLHEIADDGVAVIHLNRPEKLNAVTWPMAAAYAETLRNFDDNERVRVIVVTGAGRGFCSGADLGELARTPEMLTSGFSGEELAPTTALSLRKPVIAAINGPTAGLGFVYAMSADIRFIHPDATMKVAFPELGLVAEYGLAWLLPRIIGYGRATELLMSSRTIGADEAVRIGLAQAVESDVLGAATTYARELIARCAPTSWATIKQQLLLDGSRSLPDALAHSAQLMRQSFEGPDVKEALTARSEKRPPRFAPLPPPPPLET